MTFAIFQQRGVIEQAVSSACFGRTVPACSAGASVSLRVGGRLVGQLGFRRRDFFQHGILLQFLLDQRLQFQRRRLEQRQRLLELRRQHQRLRQARDSCKP